MYTKTVSPKYLRDNNTLALVNIDDSEYNNIISMRKKDKKLRKMESDMSILQNQIEELKQLVLGRINKNDY